jgi:hypothetical protein
MTEGQQPLGVARRRPPADVDPLVWGVLGGGALAAVIVLTLLVSDSFSGRGLLLVFAVPLLVLGVAGVARRLRPGARRARRDPGAGGLPGGGD